MNLGHKGPNYAREEVVHGKESARGGNSAFQKDKRFASAAVQIKILYRVTRELKCFN